MISAKIRINRKKVTILCAEKKLYRQNEIHT